MDNRADINEGSDPSVTKLSSRMLINEFGGMTGLSESLFTNLKTGIDGSKQDIQER